MRTLVRAISATISAALLSGGFAVASTVGIVPTHLEIARSGDSTDLTIENEGSDTVSYSVRAYRWQQTAAGLVDLEPSDDLVVYPQRLTLGASEQRVVRVGFTGTLRPVEQDYRILVTELSSSADAASSGTVLRVRNRVSIPLFIAPVAPKTEAQVKAAALTAAAATFSLLASGSVHLLATGLTVSGEDASGVRVFDQTLNAWYLLPSQPRVYSVPLARSACARIRRLTVDATFDGAPPLHAVVEPSSAC